MNVVLFGATGFVGGELLTQLLARPEVSGVVAFSRSPLASANPKLRGVVHADFERYDDALISTLAEARACLWTLGGKSADFDSALEHQRVTHGFTLAFAKRIAPSTSDFSFCYLSGMGADRAETSRFPWERTTRHLKGRTERDLLALQTRFPKFRVHAFRPGGILPRDGNRIVERVLARWVVRVEVLARAMIEAALRGSPLAGTLENREIRALGSR